MIAWLSSLACLKDVGCQTVATVSVTAVSVTVATVSVTVTCARVTVACVRFGFRV